MTNHLDAITRRATEAGFSIEMTGGNCQAFVKSRYCLQWTITNDQGTGLGTDLDGNFLVGAYDTETGDEVVECQEVKGFVNALAVALDGIDNFC